MSTVHADGSTWRLVGPWYRWPNPGLPDDGRLAAPALQKFAGDDFIAQFLRQPQHSLKYDEVVDVVQAHDLVAAGSRGARTLSALFALDASGDPVPTSFTGAAYRARLAPGSLRKLYQPTHDRHYLVSCELHCEEPGFPRVARHKVCQAGFVVRRRRSANPKAVTAAAIEAQAAIVRRAEADLFELLTLARTAADASLKQALRQAAGARLQDLASAAGQATGAQLLAHRRKQLAATRAGFAAWQREQGLAAELEGWFPLPGAQVNGPRGEWRTLAAGDQQADITSGEQVYPLFPLVPDPRELRHDGAGRTLYYGVMPTQDLQHDLAGSPHFDDRSTYEAWCFVRAHHACPPKVGKRPDCNGRLAWSRPTEAFRLAAPFDVLGSANRPVTIRMPDLRDLAAQAALRPRGKLSPVRFEQPQHLSPGGTMGGFAICSFSIPLITIVALFVLNLFLPIVVFLFQLWFLLVLRFCIPPQIRTEMKVDAALALLPPGVDFTADLGLEIDGVSRTAAQLKDLLTDGQVGGEFTLEDRMHEDTGGSEDHPADLRNLSNNALASLNQSFADHAALKPEDGRLPPPPEPGEPLHYEDSVTPVWPARSAA